MMLKPKLFVISLTVFVLSGCIALANGVSQFAPDDFQEDDLIGTWEDFSEIYSTERLTLGPDHTFEQVFTLDSGQQFESSGTWDVAKDDASGCTYLYLHGMRYFYQSVERAESGNRYTIGVREGEPLRYWDECGNKIVEMPDMVIMTVRSDPDSLHGIELEHMDTQKNVPDILLVLISD